MVVLQYTITCWDCVKANSKYIYQISWIKSALHFTWRIKQQDPWLEGLPLAKEVTYWMKYVAYWHGHSPVFCCSFVFLYKLALFTLTFKKHPFYIISHFPSFWPYYCNVYRACLDCIYLGCDHSLVSSTYVAVACHEGPDKRHAAKDQSKFTEQGLAHVPVQDVGMVENTKHQNYRTERKNKISKLHHQHRRE